MSIATPWRIDEDNEQRIVVKDGRGCVVHECDYGDIPTERGPAFREQIVRQERDNVYTMVRAVNTESGSNPDV